MSNYSDLIHNMLLVMVSVNCCLGVIVAGGCMKLHRADKSIAFALQAVLVSSLFALCYKINELNIYIAAIMIGIFVAMLPLGIGCLTDYLNKLVVFDKNTSEPFSE